MKIAAIKERIKGELRTAITPDVAAMYVKKGFEVIVEKDIGIDAGFTNNEYQASGAKVSAVSLEILSDADIILKVRPSPLDSQMNEVTTARQGACIIGLLAPYNNTDYLNAACKKKLSTIAMELVPRISRAQNMDVLSSQSNLVGYRAVIEAAYYFDRAFPMMMTAAGTINPAKVLILGAGVTGLQAVATAKRLGASVTAYDVRDATKEQVESLGAKFIFPEIVEDDQSAKNAEDNKGYAKEVTKDFAQIQAEFLHKHVPNFDIVITTAQIPGKAAPVLLDKTIVQQMKLGSVIVDIATSSGGNVVDSAMDKIVSRKGVKIIGWSNLAAKVAHDASKLYARNLYNFVTHAVNKEDELRFKDEIVEEMLISKNGHMVNKKFEL